MNKFRRMFRYAMHLRRRHHKNALNNSEYIDIYADHNENNFQKDQTNNTGNIIEVHGLTTEIGGHVIHQNLNLTIHDGETVGIIGESGSGKTTLMRSILMLQPPAAGQIKVFGVDVRHCSDDALLKVKHRCGVAFQHGALFSSLTVLENIIFPLREFTDLDVEEMQKIALAKLELVGLTSSAASKYPGELSGGMIKRVAIARAIVLDAKLLFLDEPTVGLDPKGADNLDELILNLQKDLKLTVVLITHDMPTLWHVTQRVAFIGDKKILDIAHLEDLMKNPHPVIQNYFATPRAHEQRGH